MNKKGYIITIIVLLVIVLILLGIIVYDRTHDNKCTTKKIEEVHNHNHDTKVFEVPLKGDCVDTSNLDYYDYLSYEVHIDDINFKYSWKTEGATDKYFINDTKVFEREGSGGILEKVCTYDNYVLATVSWEDVGYTIIMNVDGSSAREISKDYKYNDGILTFAGNKINLRK